MTQPAEQGPHDFRLAAAAMTAWAAVLWGIQHAASTVVLVAIGVFAVAAGLALAVRSFPMRYLLALCGCTAAAVLCSLSIRVHQASDSDLARLAAARVDGTIDLVVTGDPRPLQAKGPGGDTRSAVPARVLAIRINGRLTPSDGGPVLVLGPAESWTGVLPGQRVRMDAKLARPLPGGLLAATLSARSDPLMLGSPPWWQRAAGAVRTGLQRACRGLPTLPRGLLPGLVDGDTNGLDPVLAERFRVAGLSHLVAVSGTNLSIVVGAVALVMKRLRASPRAIAIAGGLTLVAFVIIARPSASVLRAAVMAGIALLATAFGRQRSAMPLLAGAVLLLLAWQPGLAVDLGFTLSVAATVSLVLLAPGWAAALQRWHVPVVLAEAVAVAAAAHLVTAPIVAAMAGRVSLVAIAANVLAEPVVAAATVLGALAAGSSVVWPSLAALCAQLAGWPCRWLVWVAEYFGSLPGATVPWPSGVAGGIELATVVLIAVRLCRRARPRALCAVAAGLALVIQIPVRSVTTGWPPTGWLVVACDVGQGDAVALNSGPGQAVLIDAGPEPVAVDRCLRALGIRHIPLLIVTHAHLDHVGGLSGALHDRQVDRVLTSPLRDPMSGYRLESAVLGSRGLVAGSVVSGTAVDVGAVHLDFLGPRHVFAGTRSDPNNSSVIVRATLHGRRVLLAADAEVDAQDDLLAAGVDLRADILKVPHHGSAYSDPSFLQATHAALGLVSVGAGNDYGLPSPLLIAELGRLAMVTRRTDQDGDIAVVDDGTRLSTVVRSTTNGNATRSIDGSLDGTKRPAQAARAPPAAARPAAYWC